MFYSFHTTRLLGRGGQADKEVRVPSGARSVGEEGLRGNCRVHRRQGQDGERFGAERHHFSLPRHRRRHIQVRREGEFCCGFNTRF